MRIILLCCLIVLFSCNESSTSYTPAEVIETYYEGFNTSDYDLVQTVLADSLTVNEGPFGTTFSQEAYYVFFQWDSVFTPFSKLSDFRTEKNQISVLVSTTSQRYTFLENNPFSCEHTFTILSGKISAIEIGACPGEDRNVWQSNRDSLVAWINQYHPDMSGFIHDLTKEGAEKYVSAIQLYESR